MKTTIKKLDIFTEEKGNGKKGDKTKKWLYAIIGDHGRTMFQIYSEKYPSNLEVL